MLREFKDVRQVPGERRRRYWSDKTFELFAWFEPDGSVWGFELRYKAREDKPLSALRWTPQERFTRGGIDTGSVDGLDYNVGLHLSGPGDPFTEGALRRFRRAAAEVDPAVRGFVAKKLADSLSGN